MFFIVWINRRCAFFWFLFVYDDCCVLFVSFFIRCLLRVLLGVPGLNLQLLQMNPMTTTGGRDGHLNRPQLWFNVRRAFLPLL
jgi:hypothetical protein